MSENRYNVFSRKKADSPLETHNPSLFEKIGGESVVGQAVDVFYRRVMRDARINYFFFGVNITEQAEKQKAFLTMVCGGPHQYTGRDMSQSHAKLLSMGMNDRHFNLVMDHLQGALEELQVDELLVTEVLAIAESTREEVMGRKTAGQERASGREGRSQPPARIEPSAPPAPGRYLETAGPKRGTVGSIMSGRVVTLQPDTSIRDAVELFAQGEFQAVPVINAQGQLLGILTANDLLRETLR